VSDLKVDGIIASTGTNTNLTLQGKGTGKVAIGDGALLFPDADGSANQVIETNASGVLSFVTLPSAGFTLSSEQATTSGSSASFTSIPSGVTMIIVSWEGLSTTGGGIDGYLQIGDSGGLETSGYLGSIARVPSGTPVVASQTNGMYFADNWGGVSTGKHGQAVLTLKDSSNFTWIMTSMSGQDSGQNEQMMGAFSKSLSAELDRLSLFTTGTFDAGSVALLYQ